MQKIESAFYLVLMVLFCNLLSCQTEAPLPEPEEELNMVEEVEELPEEVYEQYVEEAPPPVPPPPPQPPRWQYGYREGSFQGNIYTPGVYNFGTEVSTGASVYYARQCDCVYAQSNGEIVGIVTKGDHPLVYPGKNIVKLADGAMMHPRALIQDPLTRSLRKNAWE